MNYHTPPAKMPNQGNLESLSTDMEDVFGKPASKVKQIFESIVGMISTKEIITASILCCKALSECWPEGTVKHDCHAENKKQYLVDLLMKFGKRASIESDNTHLACKSRFLQYLVKAVLLDRPSCNSYDKVIDNLKDLTNMNPPNQEKKGESSAYKTSAKIFILKVLLGEQDDGVSNMVSSLDKLFRSKLDQSMKSLLSKMFSLEQHPTDSRARPSIEELKSFYFNKTVAVASGAAAVATSSPEPETAWTGKGKLVRDGRLRIHYVSHAIVDDFFTHQIQDDQLLAELTNLRDQLDDIAKQVEKVQGPRSSSPDSVAMVAGDNAHESIKGSLDLHGLTQHQPIRALLQSRLEELKTNRIKMDPNFEADLRQALEQTKDLPLPGTPVEKAMCGQLWNLDDFVVEKVLGVGNFGVVVQVFPKGFPECQVVLKLELFDTTNIVNYLVRPFCCHAKVVGDNVAPVLGYFSFVMDIPKSTGKSATKPKKSGPQLAVAIVMEAGLRSLGDMEEELRIEVEDDDATKHKKLMRIGYYVGQTFSGLQACHAQGIIHRDIKPDNIVLFRDNNVKICDFGLAKHDDDEEKCHTTKVGTLKYQAPELDSESGEYDVKVDVWSTGVTLVKLITGGFPPKTKLPAGSLDQWIPEADEPDKWVEFCSKLLCADASNRLSADAAKEEIFRLVASLEEKYASYWS